MVVLSEHFIRIDEAFLANDKSGRAGNEYFVSDIPQINGHGTFIPLHNFAFDGIDHNLVVQQ